MYPKVKVRQEQEQYQEDHRVVQDNNLKARVSLPPVINQKDVSHPPSAEVPKCYVLHTPKPRVPVSEDLGACNLASDSSGLTGQHEKDDNIDEDRVNIRATSVPPPRAVISSPDNDMMIGNKNRIKGRERLPGKNYGVLQNRHTHCKVKSSNVTGNSPNMRKPKEAADKSSNVTNSPHKSRRPTKSASNQKIHQKQWEF